MPALLSGKTAFTRLPPAHIAVAGFDGSLELLLHLLADGRLEVTALSLAAVADQYLATVRLLPADGARLDFLAEFLVVGSQLLLLKSRALLPREAARMVEEVPVDEATLEARLREYRRYRQVAGRLDERQHQGTRAFSRPTPPPLPPPAAPPRLERAAPEQLAAALQRLLTARWPEPDPPAAPRVTIGERIGHIREALAQHGRVLFEWLAESCQTRGELIVTFLAVLELFRAHAIELEQDELFGAIWLAGK
ncbi:MAG: Segregation and condensation protein A [uncultured Chloroflexi bacterium]|uniref:Segregation and condensation protein A n=1 Tax=uncultured Chloroflexota bacterium TaxID=166587 RepID=A0A6J4K3C3_9CHLR|nr:MAG: Segregation and condensation protein A [uncultured Chloroflexota bacterium]